MANDLVALTPTMTGLGTAPALTRTIIWKCPWQGDENNSMAGNGGSVEAFVQLAADSNPDNFQRCFPMSVDLTNKVAYGFVRKLQPDTEYRIKIAFTDPDGASMPFITVVKTAPDYRQLGTGPVRFVQVGGNDDTGTGSMANPFASATKAFFDPVPGMTIYVRGGTYYYPRVPVPGLGTTPPNPDDPQCGLVTFAPINPVGVKGNPMTIMNYNGEPVIFEGEFKRPGMMLGRYSSKATDVVVKADPPFTLTMQNLFGSGVKWHNNSEYLTVEDVRFLELIMGAMGTNENNAFCNINNGRYVTFRRNQTVATLAPFPAGWPGPQYWKTAVQMVYLWEQTGGFHSIYSNKASGGHIDDMVATGREGQLQGWIGFSEFYWNEGDSDNDDGWQGEGKTEAVVAWENTVLNALKAGVAAAPVVQGPYWVIRNRCLWPDIARGAGACGVKLGDNSYGKAYFVHNTWSGCGQGVAHWATGPYRNMEFWNNILDCQDYAYWELMPGCILRNNLLWKRPGGNNLMKLDKAYIPFLVPGSYQLASDGKPIFDDIASWNAATRNEIEGGQDVGSIQGDPLVDANTGALAPGSPAIDRGSYFTSEIYSGTGPDMGAVESDLAGTTYPFQVNVIGQGTVSPSNGDYASGQKLFLHAEPADGWTFRRYQGDVTGTLPDLEYVILKPTYGEAVFEELGPGVHEVTIVVIGEGDTDPLPDIYTVPDGDEFIVRQTAKKGWKFDHWTVNGAVVTAPELRLVITATTRIAVEFVPGEVKGGSVLPALAFGGAVILGLAALGRK